MRMDPHPYAVREIVAQVFESYDLEVRSLSDLDETILIDDGRYASRSYNVDGYMAMWLVEIGVLQFYDEEGNMLQTVNLFEELELHRMAA